MCVCNPNEKLSERKRRVDIFACSQVFFQVYVIFFQFIRRSKFEFLIVGQMYSREIEC
jgi:hypothetical protein